MTQHCYINAEGDFVPVVLLMHFTTECSHCGMGVFSAMDEVSGLPLTLCQGAILPYNKDMIQEVGSA